MMNLFGHYAIKYGLQPADRIIEPIFQTGISKHHVIYLGIDDKGIEWIAENQKFAGVRLVKATDYFKAGKSYTAKKFEGTYQDRIAAVQRALAVLGQPYDLILYNCEHYASYVQTGNAQSSQVTTAFGVVCGILLVALTIR